MIDKKENDWNMTRKKKKKKRRNRNETGQDISSPSVLTGSKGVEGALLVQPGQRGAAEVIKTTGAHAAVVRLQQRLRDEGEDPEFPVGQRPLPDIGAEHLLELAVAGMGHGGPRGWQLGLGVAMRQRRRLRW